MKIKLQNVNTKVIKEQKIGWSWTQFFWGSFVPLCKADWLGLLIEATAMIVISACTYGFGSILIFIGFGGFYNRWYVKRQLQNGWIPYTTEDAEVLQQHNITA
ncbi:hypothetical protein [Ligilactobacillus acidipiscis]|uniref:hypothetical protein n=1 Tax=Ligilactobacillus acidipiscis TaxID=89059 RepID=UPI0023F963C8|nr:hypothetical protein [Ligilactobacillus acidipiscis]WEV56150.1 hypothetical protein OZX66_07790 [Ligilactobacillus acidipiscis]